MAVEPLTLEALQDDIIHFRRRTLLRAKVAFLILAAGVVLALYRQQTESAARSRDHTKVEHALCAGQNEIRREAQTFVIRLAPESPYPKGMLAPQKAAIDHANAVKTTVRAEARDSFKIVDCP